MNFEVPLVLTFSASDPTSGAGLQADALTVASLGAHPLTVLTGITAQNTTGVSRFEPLASDWVASQWDSLGADVRRPNAIKCGVLGSVGTVEFVASLVRQLEVPLVLDPVMASGRGDAFGQKEVFKTMIEQLIPLATLITPNWPEGRALTGKRAPHTVAKHLLDLGCKAVLLKGEHIKSEKVINRLYQVQVDVQEFPTIRLPNQYHGSGCTLASACAVGLARGLPLFEAVSLGLEYTAGALKNAYEVGQGQMIPDRMHLIQQFVDV